MVAPASREERGQSAENPHGQITDQLKGEWVGAFQLAKELVYFRVAFKTEQQGATVILIRMMQVFPGTTAAVRVESSRISFELPRDAAPPMAFSGQLVADTIAGTVQHRAGPGTFQLVRTTDVDPTLYDEYAGSYELEPNRIVFISRRDFDDPNRPMRYRSALAYMDESGRQGILSPSSESAFFAGPTYAVSVPVELRITFLRNDEGRVTGLRWHPNGRPEQFAPRRDLYVGEEVRFQSGDVTLGGRLLVPSTRGPHPAVVLVMGRTGRRAPADRHTASPLAEVLARHGIAALTYVPGADPQGDSPLGSLADDALAAVQYLRHRNDMDPRQVGLYGISWTAVAAPLAASRSADVAFLIIVSGPGLSLGDRYLGLEHPARARGYSEEETRQEMTFKRLEVEFSRTGRGWERLKVLEDSVRTMAWFSGTWTVRLNAESRDAPLWRELLRSSLDDHPVAIMKQVTCPVLAIYGELDDVVPFDPNGVLIERALRERRSRDYTIRTIPRADHGLWDVQPGGPAATTGFAPGYLATLTAWLLERVRVAR